MDKNIIKHFVENNPRLVSKKETSIPGVYLLKYNNRVFYENKWNDILQECRGTLIDEDYNVVSRPFTKIFNYGENGTTLPMNEPCLAYRKVNGFMAAITIYNDELLVSTTGSIDSEFAILAKKKILKTCNIPNLEQFLRSSTYDGITRTAIVEIVDPSDPHIIPEEEGIYLLGIRENKWEADQNRIIYHSHSSYRGTTSYLGMKHCEVIETTFDKILDFSKVAKHEGFVVYGLNSGINLKIKSPYYLMKKFLSRKNENKLSHLIDHPQEIKKIVDEEYYPVVNYICSIKDQYIALDEQGRLEVIRKFIGGI